MISALWFGFGAVAGAGGAAALWGFLRYRSQRASAPVDPDRYTPREGGPFVWTPPASDLAAPTVPSSPDPLGLGPPRPQVVLSPEQVRLSERVIVHLAREGRIDPEAPVRRSRTQQGIAEAAASNQSAVSKVLRRLIAAGMVTEERRHVEGGGSRRKAYALSRRGELLAREISRRRKIDLLPPRPSEPPEPRC